MTESYKLEFYKYLNRELNLSQFEEFVYAQKSLEQGMDMDIYLDLIGFNFKEKNATDQLDDFILDRLISESEFETWRLKKLLNEFIETEVDIDKKLDKLYSMYFSSHNRQGDKLSGYRFLGNLGLNYFYWMDEGYLNTIYGRYWKKEQEKAADNFKFYHSQLKPTAQRILDAIENKDIEIIAFGKYSISDILKADLESDQIFKLKHKKSR